MTLAQLKSFVLVAELGSVKRAAQALEVSEPAVSVAVGALRRELGDELFVRSGRGIALTPGGRRLAALAGEIVGLAEHARRAVRETPGAARRVEVAATDLVAEHIGPLLDAFSAREGKLDVAVETVAGSSFPDLLEQRRADVTLGPHPGLERSATIASVPFLRCRQLIVAPPGHPLAGGAASRPACWSASGGSSGRRGSTRRPASAGSSSGRGSRPPTSAPTRAMPRRSRRRPPAKGSC